MAIFKIHHLQRLASAKIFGSTPGCMLAEASCNISSTTGIKGIIRTEDYVDVPIHNHSQLIWGGFHADRLCDITAYGEECPAVRCHKGVVPLGTDRGSERLVPI